MIRHLLCAGLVPVVVAIAADSVSRKADEVETSDKFIALIESLEGFRAKAYADTTGHATIGYGHLIKDKESGLKTAVLTRDEAKAILLDDINDAERAVNTLVTVPLKQEQYDALVSFVFNVGWGNFNTSTLLRKLNAGHCCAVPDEMRRWTDGNKAGKIVRRKAEIAVYVGDA